MLTIAGTGPGNLKYLTVEVLEKIQKSDNILAFGRVGKLVQLLNKNYVQVNCVDEILKNIDNDRDTLLLASGDPNFYGIVEYLKKNNIYIDEVLPGISSFQYLMSKLKKSWQDAKFASLHGRDYNLSIILEYKLTILLIDKNNNPSYISKKLYEYGIRGKIYVGFNLSYDDEKIIKAVIGDEIEDYSSLGVVVIENEMA